jgi:hypothetical protein
MPLTRTNDEYISGPDGIRFFMQDGAREVPCRVSLQALSAFGKSVGLSVAVEIFMTYRDKIERAASVIYDRTGRRHYETVGVTADVLRSCR